MRQKSKNRLFITFSNHFLDRKGKTEITPEKKLFRALKMGVHTHLVTFYSI